MKIVKTLNGKELTIAVEGEINSTTSRELEEVITKSLKGISVLVFDFAKLDYLSSAGLRVLLVAQKVMNAQGSMIVKNSNPSVLEVFEITGFSSVLTLQ